MFAEGLQGSGGSSMANNPLSMKYGSGVELPISQVPLDSLRFVYGSLFRLCVSSTVYYGSRAFLQENMMKREGSWEQNKAEATRYVSSMAAEIGVSLLFAPVKFIAAYNTPRFLFDYLFNLWSDFVSVFDAFRPGLFASYAMNAFDSNADEEYNFNFFTYQIPSIVLTIVKLILRRRAVGAEKCRTKRVLGVLFGRTLLRAIIPSYSVIIPTEGTELLFSLFMLFLEQLSTSYLFRHTWPYEEKGEKTETIPKEESS